MSKHLRFGRLLSLLAIMLTLSFAWGQAQNLSSEKQLLSFGFTTAANPSAQLGSNVSGTINETAKTVAISVPYQTILTSLKASFTSSDFSNVFIGVTDPGADGTNSVSGAGGAGVNYSTPVSVVVEAENHSFNIYVVTVTPQTASGLKAFNPTVATYTKTWGVCASSTETKSVAVSGGTFSVPYGSTLTAITVTYTLSPWAMLSIDGGPYTPSVAAPAGTTAALDFTTPRTFTVKAQNGTTTNYVLTATVGAMSEFDMLSSMTFTNVTGEVINIDHTTQTIAATVPYGTVVGNITPSWVISPYARMFDDTPGTGVIEVCPGVDVLGSYASYLAGPPATVHFWILAEDQSERSEYIMTITVTPCAQGNSLLPNLDAGWYWEGLCNGGGETPPVTPFDGTEVGVVVTDAPALGGTTGTVTFTTPMGVLSVVVASPFTSADISSLATTSLIAGAELSEGSTFTVTSECGAVRTYTVHINHDAATAGKELMEFGFHYAINNPLHSYPDWTTNYYAVPDANKNVLVTVPWNTDLHQLTAYFVTSEFAEVYIAESINDGGPNPDYTLQCSDVTPNDHSNSLTYVIVAQDGTEERYEITVTKADALEDSFIVDGSLIFPHVALCYSGKYEQEIDDVVLEGVFGDDNVITVVLPNKFHTDDELGFYVEFELAEGATSVPASGSWFDFGTGLNPESVEIVVTAQDGVTTTTYTLQVEVRDTEWNDAAKITKYWFEPAPINPALNATGQKPIFGTIDEVGKTIDLDVPWNTDVTHLIASFEFNENKNYPWVRMERSEDLLNGDAEWQVSEESENDYTDPIAYTVYAESCNRTVEYLVRVHEVPLDFTDITCFEVDWTGCGCYTDGPLKTGQARIDHYAHRIYMDLPNEFDITDLAASNICVWNNENGNPDDDSEVYYQIPGAHRLPWNTALNWTKDPHTFVVVGPADEHGNRQEQEWTVVIENPKCGKNHIYGLGFYNKDPYTYESASLVSITDPTLGNGGIDSVNHVINIMVKKSADLAKLYPYWGTKTLEQYSYLDCKAKICCNTGLCIGSYLDFTGAGNCTPSEHTCDVTAEDGSVQRWTIKVKIQDTTPPEVTTWSVMAMNCSDSVRVQTNETGYVWIVNEEYIGTLPCQIYNPETGDGFDLNLRSIGSGDGRYYNSGSWLVANHVGSFAAATAVDTDVWVKTDGLYTGTYYAFSVDCQGNISCVSKQKLFLDICEFDVANLCDLRTKSDVYQYKVTGPVAVTYLDQNSQGQNYFFAQDSVPVGCGVFVQDVYEGCLDLIDAGKIKRGTTLRNMIGRIDKSSENFIFIPICCYDPTVTGQGYEVAPINLTYDGYNADSYWDNKYESMYIAITNPVVYMGASSSYGSGFTMRPNWENNVYYKFEQVDGPGSHGNIILKTLGASVNYLGTAVPTAPVYLSGIRFDYDNDHSGLADDGNSYGWFFPRDMKTKTAHPPYPRTDVIADIMPLAENTPILLANPNPATINSVIPDAGKRCGSAFIDIWNEGTGKMGITALYLEDGEGTDEFQIIDPTTPLVPFYLEGWNKVDRPKVRVEVRFCPLDEGSESTFLLVEYGRFNAETGVVDAGTTKIVRIPINGNTARVVIPEFCDNFDAWPNNVASAFGWSGNGHSRNYGSTGTAFRGVLAYNLNGGTRYLISPIIDLTNAVDPVINYYQGKIAAWGAELSTITVYAKVINANPNEPWQAIKSYNLENVPDVYGVDQPFAPAMVDISRFKGQKIMVKWQKVQNANYSYLTLDDICFQERITTPIITITPATGNFGGVQVGATSTIEFSVINTGISVLKIKSVELVQPSGSTLFTLTDTNTYPIEITTDGSFAYTDPTIANGVELKFSAAFSPVAVGAKSAKIVVTYGLFEDQTIEIPLTAEGLSCLTAAVANKGQNYAPSQNTWFKYTADKFSIVQVTSCDAHQDLVTNEYAWDTFLYVYKSCDDPSPLSNDDMEAACVYNRASSSVQTVVGAGETIYIFWPLSFPTALHAYEGFYFNINVTYPIDGDVCENAIPLTLPVVNHFGTTVGFNDDYNISPCSPFSNYMDGNDKVYKISLPYEGYLTGSLLGAYGSIHVLDVCPTEELEKFHCKLFVGGPNGGTQTKKIAEGDYYVIISTWSPPQTVDYLLNMSFQGTGVNDSELTSNLNVFPNPTNGKFTVSISNPEAMDMTIELVSISGQVVYRNEVKATSSYNNEIDATTFAKGVYYLKVNNGKDVKIEKVVVQ